MKNYFRMYGEFQLVNGTKTPRYVLARVRGYKKELNELRGRTGEISLYLIKRQSKKGRPSFFLQAKNSYNLSGLFAFSETQYRYAYGNPLQAVTYGKENRQNPLIDYVDDAFLFKFFYNESQVIPQKISFFWMIGEKEHARKWMQFWEAGELEIYEKYARENAIPYK